MSDRVVAWVLRVSWSVLPVTAGPLFAAGLRHHSAAVRLAASTGAWAAWAAVLVALLVPHPIGLTVLRCVAPAAVAAALIALTADASVIAAVTGVAWTAGVALSSFIPATGVVFVNGPAYPNERRFPLAPPGPLLLGPIEVAWALVVGLPIAAVLLLAARRWVLGVIATAAGVAVLWVLGRSLHGLSRRWVVFVPAGLVIHDPMALADPVLFVREAVRSLQPAPGDSPALDLTQGALGLAVELRLDQPVPLQLTRRAAESDSVLFTPTRPGRMLEEAARRRLPVGS